MGNIPSLLQRLLDLVARFRLCIVPMFFRMHGDHLQDLAMIGNSDRRVGLGKKGRRSRRGIFKNSDELPVNCICKRDANSKFMSMPRFLVLGIDRPDKLIDCGYRWNSPHPRRVFQLHSRQSARIPSKPSAFPLVSWNTICHFS